MKKTKLNRLFSIESALIISVLFVFILAVKAQQPLQQEQQDEQPPKIIEFEADELRKSPIKDMQILKNNVIFYHDGAFMYCDSAYLFQISNRFEAFSNVKIDQGDTIFVYGDYLHYDGNTQLAQLRNNVRMEDKEVTLFTDSLNYDRIANLGYYFDGGMLVDEENELTSYWGQYNPENKEALFSDSVKLINEDYTIFADTLKYNTFSKIANILGPSTIVSDSGYIHTTRGWYNTITDDSQLLDRSTVYSSNNDKSLTGDTIYYNGASGIGIVHGNMFLQDTARKVILQGNYGFYNEQTEYAMATDSAFAIEYSQKDSLFLHADTLIMLTDSVDREMKAYYNVRFYRTDLQGVCDSMEFISKDSILYMYTDPILWHENNQIIGEEMNIFMNDSTIDKVHVKDYAFSIQDRQRDDQYNQLKGRDMNAHFRDGELYYILVEGDAESLYYLEEDDGSIVGLNKTESAYLSMDILHNELQKLKLWSSTTAQTDPLSILKPEDKKLKGFVWYDDVRPLNKFDIFRKPKKGSIEPRQTPRKFERE
ncbi:MAG TPA: OstA-like protein [Dysgonamonadaceae bacterium]|nr:OstA-like protein [Dysgonamonadaceae bacterium]